MTKVVWGTLNDRTYETGVDQGVLYPNGADGVAWNGLSAVRELPNVEEPAAYYLDGVKYLSVAKSGEFSGVIEALTYPDEFAEYDGWSPSINGLSLGGQRQKTFGFCYRTIVGNGVDGRDYAYKIHLVYQALAIPVDRDYTTLTDSPDISPLSWSFTTTPIAIPGRRPLAHVAIDSSKTHFEMLTLIEDILYGTSTTEPRLPTLQELVDLFTDFVPSSELQVNDLGNGQYTVQGSDVELVGDTFTINSPPATNNGDGTFTIP